MTRQAEKDIRSALAGARRALSRLAMVRTSRLSDVAALQVFGARRTALQTEKRLVALLLGAEETRR